MRKFIAAVLLALGFLGGCASQGGAGATSQGNSPDDQAYVSR